MSLDDPRLTLDELDEKLLDIICQINEVARLWPEELLNGNIALEYLDTAWRAIADADCEARDMRDSLQLKERQDARSNNG